MGNGKMNLSPERDIKTQPGKMSMDQKKSGDLAAHPGDPRKPVKGEKGKNEK